MTTLHGTVLSPYVRKVRVFCHEKGIAIGCSELSPAHDGPRLRAMSPLGKIPILERDGAFVPDSSVICAFLERLHPSPPLLPAAAADYARALFLEEWADTRGLEAFHPALVERVIRPRLLQQAPDEARVARARREEVPAALDWLESQVGGADGLVAGRFTLADCAVGAQLQGFELAGEEVDGRRWPRVRAYADTVLARPSFRAQAEALAAAG